MGMSGPQALTEAYRGREHVLEHLKVGARYVTDRAVLEDHPDYIAYAHEGVVTSLTSYVLADHIASDTYTAREMFEAPRSTWQMFKRTHAESWWLGWLVRWHPVENATETRLVSVQVKRYLTYPDAAIRTPSLGPYRVLEQVSPLWTRP